MAGARVNAGSPIGPLLAAPTLTWLIVNWSWRGAFTVLVVAGAVWTIAWSWSVERMPLRKPADRAKAGSAPDPNGHIAVPFHRVAGSAQLLGLGFERERSGRGAHVETSLLEAVLSAQAATWGEYVLTGTAPRRRGNGQANAAPAADVLALTGGAIVLSAYTAEKWAALCELVGRPDMVDDPRFADNAARVRNRPEMLAALRSGFAGMTRDQAITALRSAGIVCGAVRSFDEVAADEDVACSNVMVEVTDRRGRRVTSPGTAFTIDGRRRTASTAAPPVGADTTEVLRELGYPDEAISDLTTRRVVGAPAARPDERRASR